MRNLVCGSGLIGSFLSKQPGYFELDQKQHKALRYAGYINSSESAELVASLRLANPTAFVNASGPSNILESFERPEFYTDSPVEQCREHLRILSQLPNPPIYIFISSGAAYGNAKDSGSRENDSLYPESPYATGKINAEQYLSEMNGRYPAPIYILRVYSAYSNDLKTRLPFLLVSQILTKDSCELFGNGDEKRNFVHLNDIREVIDFLLANSSKLKSEIFNVGSDKSITIRQLCEIALATAKVLLPFRKNLDEDFFKFNNQIRIGDPKNMICDMGRMGALGHFPTVSPEIGLQGYFRWNLKRN